MQVIELLLTISTIIGIFSDYMWYRSLKRRERIVRRAEQLLEKAVKAQGEQVKATQHMLNGQKLRYFALNSQAKEIETFLKEARDIAGNFYGKSKKARRNNGR